MAAGLVAAPGAATSAAPVATPSGLRGTVLPSEYVGQLPSVVLTDNSGFPATEVADPASAQRLFLLSHYQQMEAKVWRLRALSACCLDGFIWRVLCIFCCECVCV